MPPRTPAAFTLVELLVVISLIALLIAILLPALGAAKQHARMLEDITRQRAVAQVSAVYANDNDSRLPRGRRDWPADDHLPWVSWSLRESLTDLGLTWEQMACNALSDNDQVWSYADDTGPVTVGPNPVGTQIGMNYFGARELPSLNDFHTGKRITLPQTLEDVTTTEQLTACRAWITARGHGTRFPHLSNSNAAHETPGVPATGPDDVPEALRPTALNFSYRDGSVATLRYPELDWAREIAASAGGVRDLYPYSHDR